MSSFKEGVGQVVGMRIEPIETPIAYVKLPNKSYSVHGGGYIVTTLLSFPYRDKEGEILQELIEMLTVGHLS
jgi:hypothetical protein